jgi:hypothetical protein
MSTGGKKVIGRNSGVVVHRGIERLVCWTGPCPVETLAEHKYSV